MLDILIKRDQIVAVVAKIETTWKLSFSFTAYSINKEEVQSIMRLSIGGNQASFGDRIPGVFINHTSSELFFRTALGSNLNYKYNDDCSSEHLKLQINSKYFIEISQIMDEKSGNIIFSAKINGNSCDPVINTQPRTFNNVLMYVSDPWYLQADGIIENLYFENSPMSSATTTTTSPPITTIFSSGPISIPGIVYILFSSI